MCFWESRRTTNDGMLTTCFLTLMCLCLIRTLAWWIDLKSPELENLVCSLRSKKSSILRPSTKSSFILVSSKTPILTSLLRRAFPSKSLFWSFSSSVSSSLAADLILARLYLILQTSLLFLRPYSPMSFNSWSKRAFSKGLLGVLYTLEYTMGTRPLTILFGF